MNKRDFNRLVSENDQNARLLKDSHQSEIKKCLTYVQFRGINKYDYEALRKDLISMCFEREIREEDIDFTNIKNFCDAYIAKYNKGNIIALLFYISSALLLYFVFDLFFSNINEITTITVFRFTLTLLIFVMFYFLSPYLFLSSNKKMNFYFLLFLSFIIIFAYAFFHIVGIIVLFRISFWARLSYHITFFTVISVFWNRYRNILK